MTIKYKPFRIVNCQELSELQQRFVNNLALWNNQHALFPLTCTLRCDPKPNLLDSGVVFMTEQEQPVAMLVQKELSVIKNCLFSDDSDCFDAISETLFIALLNQLLGTESLQRQPNNPHLDEWFYKGTPSLAITFSLINQSMTIYLHPLWALKTLPSHKVIQKPLSELREALEPHSLHWQVELTPVVLPLEALIHLQVGDVIRTDHRLTTPLLLNNNQQAICQVEIGEIDPYKSIQITSSL